MGSYRTALLVLVILWIPRAVLGQAGISGSILQLTGNKRVKIVWQRDMTAAGDNVFGGADVFRLVGYDTDDDTIRVILSTQDDYTKPLLTHDGNRIVWSDRVVRQVKVCNWDGSGIRQVASGFAGAVWFDDSTGKQWVYFQEGGDGDNDPFPLKRVNLDNTGEVELIWDDTNTNAYWMSISSDGARIASSWPWPDCGAVAPNHAGSGGGDIYYPPSGYYTTGCWTTITPDTNYRVGVFDGPHRAWKTWDWPTGQMRTLDLHSAPGINGWEIYHPKMSNHPRFLTITGPYSNGTMGDNNIMAGGTQIEIYLGKVDAGFTQVTDWVRVTDNARAEFFPDVWVDPGTSTQVRIDSFTAVPDTIAQGGTATLSWSTTYATAVSIDQGIGGVSASGSTVVAPLADTVYTLTAQGDGGPVSRQAGVTVVSLALPIAVNCGDGTPAVAGWGDEDLFRTGGGEYDFSGPVDLNGQPDPAPADVYLTCVHLDHGYSFPLPDGTYTVRLHFFDGPTASGRAMDYTIEGIKVLDDFSIVDEAGGGGRALIREFTVVVSDGNGLQIVAEQDAGNDAFESGIEILEGGVVDDQDPVVTIATPADGATISGDVVVQGTASDNVGIARVEVNIDGGAWELASGTTDWTHTFYALALSDGLHTITARATDPAGNRGTTWIQVTTFNQPSITIQVPAGGETWQAGSSQFIQWTAENLDDVTLNYSVDGGASYQPIVQSVGAHEPGWGNYPWTVPNEGTVQARILVHGYFDSTVRAESNLFTIVASGDPRIDLLSPRAGDTLTGNSLYAVTWDATDVETVVLEYSLDAGGSYEPIATVGSADPGWGGQDWLVPNVATTVAQVRARTPAGATEDLSGLFAIEPQAVQAGEVEVTRLEFSATVPEGAGTVTEVQVDGNSFPVADDGTFDAVVDLPVGVAQATFAIETGDGTRRLIRLDIRDAEPPIPGLGVSAADLREFLGGRSGVLVWVDAGGSIQVLDFREDQPAVRALPGASDAINPLLSPDGTRLVYSQGQPNGPKFIHVSTLDGSQAEQVAVGDVGYWSFAGSGEAVITCDWSDKAQNGADGKTYRQPLVAGGVSPDGAAAEICPRAMDGGPNGEFTWLGQVYENLWAYNLATGIEYPTDRFFLPGGAVADHQTCNGSMAPDGTGRLMCLVIPHDYVRVFSYDAGSDSFLQTSEFQLPPGMAEWEFPEWSTDPGYFTAVLRASDLQNRLFLVKVEEGSLVPEILEISGEEKGMTYSHLFVVP